MAAPTCWNCGGSKEQACNNGNCNLGYDIYLKRRCLTFHGWATITCTICNGKGTLPYWSKGTVPLSITRPALKTSTVLCWLASESVAVLSLPREWEDQLCGWHVKGWFNGWGMGQIVLVQIHQAGGVYTTSRMGIHILHGSHSLIAFWKADLVPVRCGVCCLVLSHVWTCCCLRPCFPVIIMATRRTIFDAPVAIKDEVWPFSLGPSWAQECIDAVV
jgi:hypothetical protein